MKPPAVTHVPLEAVYEQVRKQREKNADEAALITAAYEELQAQHQAATEAWAAERAVFSEAFRAAGITIPGDTPPDPVGDVDGAPAEPPGELTLDPPHGE